MFFLLIFLLLLLLLFFTDDFACLIRDLSQVAIFNMQKIAFIYTLVGLLSRWFSYKNSASAETLCESLRGVEIETAANVLYRDTDYTL